MAAMSECVDGALDKIAEAADALRTEESAAELIRSVLAEVSETRQSVASLTTAEDRVALAAARLCVCVEYNPPIERGIRNTMNLAGHLHLLAQVLLENVPDDADHREVHDLARRAPPFPPPGFPPEK